MPISLQKEAANTPIKNISKSTLKISSLLSAAPLSGLEKIIAKRLGKGVIGFGAEKDTEKSDVKLLSKSELLGKVEPEDLIQYGMIPEFVGRFHSIANCNELSVEDLISILTEPKNAVVKQFISMFENEGVKLTFTPEALRSIADKAIEAGTGARALRMILETMMRDLMFEIPSDDTVTEVMIEKECVTMNEEPIIKRKTKKIA